jgi:Papain family cysteine protease
VIVNLSEQDFMEHESLIWAPAFFNDSGFAFVDLNNAASFGYHFAYENQWDYNPSLYQSEKPIYINSCEEYPYPSVEAGCSDSAPQAPGICTYIPNGRGATRQCAFSPVVLSSTSPYMSDGAVDVWNLKRPDLSIGYALLALAFNNAVILEFNVTDTFQGSPEGFINASGVDFDLLTSVGSHSVHVVGYVSNSQLAGNSLTANQPAANGGGYFILKNSWGTCLGDAGYYYMPVFYLQNEATALDIVSRENQ